MRLDTSIPDAYDTSHRDCYLLFSKASSNVALYSTYLAKDRCLTAKLVLLQLM